MYLIYLRTYIVCFPYTIANRLTNLAIFRKFLMGIIFKAFYETVARIYICKTITARAGLSRTKLVN